MTTNTDGAMPELPVVGALWQYIGPDPMATHINPCARALHEMNPDSPPYPETWQLTDKLVKLSDARAAIQQAAGAVPEALIALGKTIATQDNRATDAPIFIVQQKRSYVTEEGYNDSRYEWRETESGDYSGPDDEELARLDKFYANEGHEPKGWKRFAIMDVWEFVTACFTEQGCKDYIAINGHNLKEPRIYAEGSFRNEEFRSLRKTLIALAASPAPPKQQPVHLGGGEVGGVPLTEQDIRSIWQTIDTGDIEDDLMAFAQAIIVAQTIISASEADALLKTLSGIANVNQREWDEAYRHPAHFKEWAQSRARHAITAHGIGKAPRSESPTGQINKPAGQGMEGGV